jgi:hypothetical protein
MGSAKRLRVDVATICLVGLLGLALCDCYFRLLNYLFLGEAASNAACTALGAGLFCLLVFLLRKNFAIYRVDFCKWDILALGLVLLVVILNLPFPDLLYDAMYMEIYLQEFALSAQQESMKPYIDRYVAFYSLHNRLFYYARMLLGYRLQLLVYFPVVIASYYKVKQILKYFWQRSCFAEKLSAAKEAALLSFLAILPLTSDTLVAVLLILKSDAFIVPLFLECLWLIIAQERFERQHYLWGGLLFGFTIALKLTNPAFMLPLLVWVVVREAKQKNIKITDVIFAGLLGLLAVLPFAAYAWHFTGSPVFPFFNAIFHSAYFPAVNFQDPKWGGEGFISTVLWPFFSFVNPARLDMTVTAPISNGRAALGYLAAFCSFFVYYDTALLKKRLPLILVLFSSGMLWSFSSGYARYGVMLEVFATLFLLIWLFDLFALKRYVLREVFSCLLAASVLLAAYFSYQSYDGWRFAPLKSLAAIYYEGEALADFTDSELYKEQFDNYLAMAGENLSYLGRDRQVTRDPALKQKLARVETWFCLEPLTQNALMIMANPKADFVFFCETQEGQSVEYQGGLYEYIPVLLSSYDDAGLFTIVNGDGKGKVGQYFRSNFFDSIAAAGLAVVECEPIKLDVAFAHQTHHLLRLVRVETAERLGLEALGLENID